MALTSMTVESVSPRGGRSPTQVTVQGSGFGVTAGVVRFDPLNEDVLASIVSWGDTQVVFTVPSLNDDDKFYTVLIEKSGGSDGVHFPFWVPPVAIPPQDYQWPGAEEGREDQDVDNPRVFSAADFNRLFDRIEGSASLPAFANEQYAVLMEDPAGTPVFQRLTEDMILPAFSVGLGVVGASAYDLGESVSNPQFNASYERAPSSASLVDDEGNPAQDVTGSANPLTMPFAYTKSAINDSVQFALTAQEAGGAPETATAQIYWRPRAFWGTGAPGQSTESFIESMGSVLASGRQRTFNANAAVGEKIYYAYPVAFGQATFFVGGFEGGFLAPITVSVTNAFGVALDYYLYESAVTGLGDTDVEVQ